MHINKHKDTLTSPLLAMSAFSDISAHVLLRDDAHLNIFGFTSTPMIGYLYAAM